MDPEEELKDALLADVASDKVGAKYLKLINSVSFSDVKEE